MKQYNNVCIYMRLSKEDGDKIESESITNQRKLLTRYAEDIGIQMMDIVGQILIDLILRKC